MKIWIVVIIGLIVVGFLFWQFAKADSQRVELSKKIKIQELQIKTLEQERDEKQKKINDFMAELKVWVEKIEKSRQTTVVKQYPTFTDCNPTVTGGVHCFSL